MVFVDPGVEGQVAVSFDTTAGDPLGDVSTADPAKWSVRLGGFRYAGVAVANDSWDSVVVTLAATGPEAGADEVSYSNGPSDIADSLGRQLAAFSGLPL